MDRITGHYLTSTFDGETVRAFVPLPLGATDPPLDMGGNLGVLGDAMTGLARLDVAGEMVPSMNWFLYGFVRKEALISSQIEGTQATLQDVLAFEATDRAARPEDVEEVCNYVKALRYARGELARPDGLPLCVRLLCGAHAVLMDGARGQEKQPGEIRRSQNWIGGSRPGNARFVPPPPQEVGAALSELEKWIHAESELPPLVRVGLAHAQFETIHPFLDGNGRIGRLLITLLLEHWKLLRAPLLYVSLSFKRRRAEYYERLDRVRTTGDWEGWVGYFLECVAEAADDAVGAARVLHALLGRDRQRLLEHERASLPALRLLELLPEHPMVTLPKVVELLRTTKPTAASAISALERSEILGEITGKKRDRLYAYQGYVEILAGDTEPIAR